MASTDEQTETVSLSVENIGGIDRTELSFTNGITVLAGRNATNRTSLLRAIMAGLGSEDVSLKGDAGAGQIRLRFGGEEYTHTLSRENGTVRFDGDPYLDDAELADLFAFLLASNEARRAVALQTDLRDIVMRPVDAESVQNDIDRLQAEKASVEDEIARGDSLRRELSELQTKRSEIQADLETKADALASKRDELETASGGTTEQPAPESPLDEQMNALKEARSELQTVQFRRESQSEGIEKLKEELAELEMTQSGLPADVTDELDEVRAGLDRLRNRKQQLRSELSTLQSVIQFNEEMLEGTAEGITAALQESGDAHPEGSADGQITDQLLDDESQSVCWTCGTTVSPTRIDETLTQLREFRESKFGEQAEIDGKLTELKSQRSTLRDRRQERERVAEDIEEVRAEIEEREAKLSELDDRRRELQATVDSLEGEIRARENQETSAELELRSEINRLELERDRLAQNRESVEQQITEIEATLEELGSPGDRKAAIQEQISLLRTRIDRLERDVIEAFNEQMEAVLNRLDYENLDRIWLERVGTERRERRETTTGTSFRLHVVRNTADGTAYEDEFDHLSESEREVTGLVFALAGYLAHDVAETVPFLLLDSLEAIDAERIGALVEYFADSCQYLVVALLEEDAEALGEEYERITDI